MLCEDIQREVSARGVFHIMNRRMAREIQLAVPMLVARP